MIKLKLLHFLRNFFHLPDYAFKFTKRRNNSFFAWLWKFSRNKSLDFSNSYSDQKSILNYITSRNMSRILRPNLRNENYDSVKNKTSVLNVKEVLDMVSFSWLQSKQLFFFPASSKILKFHTKTIVLGNLASKHFPGNQPKEENEESWGGPEAFKLITFIKNDFNEILMKHSSVIVFFTAYWCPHCSRLKKPYATAALMAKEANLPVLFAVFDVNIDPDIADEKGVIGIPTIKYYKNAKLVSTYRGKRTADDLFEYVKNPTPPSTEINADM